MATKYEYSKLLTPNTTYCTTPEYGAVDIIIHLASVITRRNPTVGLSRVSDYFRVPSITAIDPYSRLQARLCSNYTVGLFSSVLLVVHNDFNS